MRKARVDLNPRSGAGAKSRKERSTCVDARAEGKTCSKRGEEEKEASSDQKGEAKKMQDEDVAD